MRSRSLFWPLVLIATGLLWLLINLGVVPSANLWALYNFVPYFILTLGIGLVLRARWDSAGRIVSSLAVGLAVLAVAFAPMLGWDKAPEWGCFWDDATGHDCNWFVNIDGSIPGSGVVVSEQRQTADFTAVSVDFPSEIVIHQGETQSVTVEAEDNLLPQLETRVANGVLYIERGDIPRAQRVNPTQTVHITLVVRDMTRLDFSTAGSVDVEGLQTDALSVSMSGAGQIRLSDLDIRSLEVNLSGAGNIEASGTADDLRLEVSGLGSFEGGDLASQTAEAGISGMGSATLWVAQQLSAEISGTGSLNYYGSPHVDQSVSGVGSVQSLGAK
jgi:hypothetical protein